MAMITTVEEAVRVAEGGVDIVVAQGSEAGGHRSTFKLNAANGEVPMVGTLTLVPQVVDAVSIPVVSAGGIMDGRGLVASLALGAAGVLIVPALWLLVRAVLFKPIRSVYSQQRKLTL
jgi:nitronate monooxygenase